MDQFVTIFDRNYLFQAMALYRSLRQHAQPFVLHALCMDQQSFEMVQRLAAPGLHAISVDDLLTDEVKAVRARTTHGQFCWVCQPLSCLHVLDRLGAGRVTYLEADSLFFAPPALLFAEARDASCCAVGHRFSPGYDQTAESGRYCVQFNSFQGAEGRQALGYWKQECFKYSKDAPGVYPGQTCLDQWGARFPGFREIEHPGAGVAPWNVQSYRVELLGGQLSVDGQPLVFYHYHQYVLYPNGDLDLGWYRLSREVVDLIYRPYVRALAEAREWVWSVDGAFRFQRTLPAAATWFSRLKRKARGVDNVYRAL